MRAYHNKLNNLNKCINNNPSKVADKQVIQILVMIDHSQINILQKLKLFKIKMSKY